MKLDIDELLFDDLSTICDQRKRLQAIMLQEAVRNLKKGFNKKFDAVMKMKHEEMSKIDGLTTKIAEITKELGVSTFLVGNSHLFLDQREFILSGAGRSRSA